VKVLQLPENRTQKSKSSATARETHPEVCKNVNIIRHADFLMAVPQQRMGFQDASIVDQDADVTNFFLHPVSQRQNSLSVRHITPVTNSASTETKVLGWGLFWHENRNLEFYECHRFML
jgi:hypothetical protein